ncbi:MAG: putative rane protein, partial [Clostridiales bacterium]|nr:putative rane protein [Clostridiales bacterium]
IVAFVCMLVMLTDVKGIISLSTVITPLMVVGILFTGIYIIISKDTYAFNVSGYLHQYTENWFFSALTYVSYNSIMSLVVMSSLLPYLKTRRVGIIGGISGGMLLCFIAFILNTAIFMFYPEIIPDELPVLRIIGKYSSALSAIYTFVLLLAMFISAVTSGFYFVERLNSKLKINMKIITMIACAFVIPLSGVGFSNLIATLYPIFGYVGLFMVFTILLQGIRLKPLKAFIKKSSKRNL